MVNHGGHYLNVCVVYNVLVDLLPILYSEAVVTVASSLL